MNNCEIIEDFYGVYLLYCTNPRYKGQVYIGYTRDPNRRINQHNRGTWAGGAHKTSNKGPWKMILIIHGFPNNIAALRFEWAWQNPLKTTRLHNVANLKKIPRKETVFQYKLRIMSEMLKVGPWCRLPLVIQWLEQDFYEPIPPERAPPTHITTQHGRVKAKNKPITLQKGSTNLKCSLCFNSLTETQMKLDCLKNCSFISHVGCLADLFLLSGDYVPIGGECPYCNTYLKWGDLIKKLNGFSLGDKCDKLDDKCDSDDDNVYSQDCAVDCIIDECNFDL